MCFNGSEETIELILRTIICVNQSVSTVQMRLQGNLLQDYEHKFEQLLEDQKLFKLCCDASLLKIVEQRQFCITPDEEEGPDEMKNLCRECTLPRSEGGIPGERVDSWKH